MKLVIVESPTKAKTISKFLDKNYNVQSSYGHIRDLPKSKLGIDVENNFEPQYVIPIKNRPNLKNLKEAVSKASEVILATDEDREGEAIAWHLVQALGLNEIKNQKSKIKSERIVFHEITEDAIKSALEHPRDIDLKLVDAQQARRVLDRLVGYKLSPFLWKKIAKGLSAGRVQSVAVRLIVEREEEIRKFKPEEYWSIHADLKTKKGLIEALLTHIGETALEKLSIKNEAEAKAIAADLEGGRFSISNIEKKTTRKNPPPPFTTSTLQQEAAKKLGFSSKKTMFLAQQLYENGLITYMRTDSVNLSQESLTKAKKYLEEKFGGIYAAEAPRQFKTTSKSAQEAHEAIRPTNVFINPDEAPLAGAPEKKLYKLIWQRFLASQMPQAILDTTSIDIAADCPNGKKSKKYSLKTTGTILKFDGYLKVWPQKFEAKELPEIESGENLSLEAVRPLQHFTEPPARFSEASLIKALESFGIGRPSTYAPTISVIQLRNYVKKEGGRFFPTEIGELVNKVLTENFPEVVDIQFTAGMEKSLDEIAEGEKQWRDVIGGFYNPFAVKLAEKYEEVKKTVVAEKTDQICEKCGKSMVIKFGRFGKFLACEGFPECRNTKKLEKEAPKSTGLKCPECGAGEIVERRVSKGRARGKIFWGCSKYPACKYASWEDPTKPSDKSDKKSEASEPDEAIEKE
jgi:DNA topoisomerase-1